MMNNYLFLSLLLVGTFQGIIGKSLDDENDDEWLADLYIKIPISPVMSFYFFNLTNPEEFSNGSKPIFTEVGPYAYKVTLRREELKWVNDSMIEFVPNQIYRYFPKKSKDPITKQKFRQFDKITTINIPLMASLHTMRNAEREARAAIAAFVGILGQKATVTKTVRELLWGYENQLLSIGETLGEAFPEENIYPYSEFGLFVGKNDTNQGTIRVASGLDNFGHLAEVKGWKEPKDTNFDDEIGFWDQGSKCNKARGSDGFVFKKNLDKAEEVSIFNRNFCRSLKYEYKEDVTDKKGFEGYRYVPSPDNFARVEENSGNGCFCSNVSDWCTKHSGLFNMSSCQYGSPVFISWPHFFQADKTLLDDVEGLEPVEEKHQSFTDISKNVGITLQTRLTTQINIAIEDYGDIELVSGLKEMIFPVMWSSLESDGADDPKIVERLKKIEI